MCITTDNFCQRKLLFLATAATADWKVASVLNRLLHFSQVLEVIAKAIKNGIGLSG